MSQDMKNQEIECLIFLAELNHHRPYNQYSHEIYNTGELLGELKTWKVYCQDIPDECFLMSTVTENEKIHNTYLKSEI